MTSLTENYHSLLRYGRGFERVYGCSGGTTEIGSESPAVKCHGVFAIFVPEESTIVGFADDQTVIVTAKHLKDVEVYATETV